MIYVLLVCQVATLWLLWRFRRDIQRRVLVDTAAKAAGILESPTPPERIGYPGAVPPNRYCVVRWPDGHHFYRGCEGATARRMYEHTNPGPGEEVEFWELNARRGRKVG